MRTGLGSDGFPRQVWTDERVELVKKLWSDGCSAAVIAGELGGVTRNAVIGKLHRLGLTGSRPRKTKPRRRPYRARRAGRPAAAQPSSLPGRGLEPRQAAAPKMLPIGRLTESTCKFPIGDPRTAEFGFCGHEAEEGLPYCLWHCGVVYSAEPTKAKKTWQSYRPRHGQGAFL